MHIRGDGVGDPRARVRGALRRTFATVGDARTGAARARTAVLNQLLLCVIVLFVAALALWGTGAIERSLFLSGVLLVFAGGAVALLVPWARIAQGWVLLLPLLDIVAIALMRRSEPNGGLGLLWAFPAIWLALLGVFGYVLQLVVITGIYWTLVALEPVQGWEYTTFLLPIVTVAIATATFVGSRRHAAQQELLDRQAGMLSDALQRAQRQEELIIEVLDAVDFGVLRVAPDGSVTMVNEAIGRFQQSIPGFGVRERALANAYQADGTTPLPEQDRPLLRAIRGEVFDNQIVWFGHPDERRAALTMTVRRMRDAFGVDNGAVLIARDVTAELTALRARDRLVASVSHELRTPLTSVLGYIDLAMDNLDDPDAARRNLEVAGRNSERLLEIVADILAASSSSRLSADMTISPEPLDAADIVRASAEAWRPRAAERAVSILTADVTPAAVFADPLRLRQVVDNLVSNAVKYNRDGGEIALACSTDEQTTRISVRDTGSGMALEDQHRLFERYYRARTDIEGTGLGLSISRDIARAHGGDITVHSERGIGSTFVVVLPATAGAVVERPPAVPDAVGGQ
ncbi:HAMP domain-containing histidine kinase [Microbacterium caowuchunii]|uniref:sensor histidine kinase n=1 Tax=Microbacterium caowuchunii TaxID=2614638 RepID=UPI001247717D|nr:HAMP domain-containing sensor histidine kinase [Microbacterium caowuchunii]QEW00199.1 HAMP domain-containing histidine kinase [Microbacterium caowuchunii]